MDMITLRQAELSDLETLYEFEQGIITAERPFDPTLKEGRINYYDLKELIQAEDTEVIVALIAHEVVGAGYIQIRKAKAYHKHNSFGYIGFMYTKPTYRRKGVIQKVTEGLTHWAKSRQLSEVRLEVYDENIPAVAAYQKAGFKKHMAEMRIAIAT